MKSDRPRQNNYLPQSFRLRIIAVALLLFVFSGCAVNKNLQPAAATPETGEGGFELADANHNGKLSRTEAGDFIGAQIFAARDTNHDGSVTKKEWTAGDPTAGADFAKRDANHDGALTREEVIKYSRTEGVTAKAFNAADKNHDGQLDRTEVQNYYNSREGSPR